MPPLPGNEDGRGFGHHAGAHLLHQLQARIEVGERAQERRPAGGDQRRGLAAQRISSQRDHPDGRRLRRTAGEPQIGTQRVQEEQRALDVGVTGCGTSTSVVARPAARPQAAVASPWCVPSPPKVRTRRRPRARAAPSSSSSLRGLLPP